MIGGKTIQCIALLMDLVMISQSKAQRNVLFTNRTDSRMKLILQRGTIGIEGNQLALRSTHDNAVELNALVECPVIGRDRVLIGPGAFDVGQSNSVGRAMERNGWRKKSMRKNLNVIRTPWATAFRFRTANDLNGVLSLEHVSGTPISNGTKQCKGGSVDLFTHSSIG